MTDQLEWADEAQPGTQLGPANTVVYADSTGAGQAATLDEETFLGRETGGEIGAVKFEDVVGLIDAVALQPATPGTQQTGNINVSGAIVNAKVKLTPEGGIAVLLVAGEALSLGNVVHVKQTSGADGKVWKNPVDSDMPIGVAYHAASADAAVWVVVSGIVSVLPESGVTATRGYVIYSSNAEAGTVDEAGTIPAATQHFRECGHWLDTGSGAGAATRALIHFN